MANWEYPDLPKYGVDGLFNPTMNLFSDRPETYLIKNSASSVILIAS